MSVSNTQQRGAIGPRPLDGVRVLSLAQQLPGPYCGLLLADLGSEVVLIEQIPRGDPGRTAPVLFEQMNRGKRSVALDLKSADGYEAFCRLVRSADIVLEGFRPGVAERLAIDYPTLKALRPGLVYCSISGYGQDGPERDVSGHDISYQARAGAVRFDDQGLRAGTLAVADLSSAMFAALAVVAAVAERSRGRIEGRYIDVSMAESVLSWNSVAVATAASGRPQREAAGGEPAYGLFRTSDGWVSLSIAHENHFWVPLCEALGRPDLGKLDGRERRRRTAELSAWLADSLRRERSEFWLKTLAERKVPVGKVNRPADTLTDPLFASRGSFKRLGEALYVMPPLRLDRALPPVTSPAPLVGEHTREYLLQAGFSEAEIEAMRAAGSAMVAERRGGKAR